MARFDWACRATSAVGCRRLSILLTEILHLSCLRWEGIGGYHPCISLIGNARRIVTRRKQPWYTSYWAANS